MRVTDKGLLRSSVRYLQQHAETLAKNQEMLGSGVRVSLPSDDPVATQRILRWNKVQDDIEQYQDNIETADIWMESSSSILSSIGEIMERVNDIALSSTSSSITNESCSEYAQEIEALLSELITLANTAVDNSYLFAGYQTDTKPFTATTNVDGLITGVTYNGDGGQREIEINDSSTITVNFIGSNDADGDGTADYSSPGVFVDANQGVDLFETLINLRDDLLNDNVTDITNLRLTEIEDVIDNIATCDSVLGLRMDATTLTADILSEEAINVASLIETNQASDYADLVTAISYEETIYEAALTTTSSLLQYSLFDFLS